ncbi:MAG: ATP phosphoribosyltransferase [Candidatus Odinarchaeia archaeon]
MLKLKIAIPKGSLNEATLELFTKAGYEIKAAERSYRPWISDPEIQIKMIRPQEIPNLVEQGMYDLGISGEDWIKETKADIIKLTDLEYGQVSIVLAVPKNWREINSLNELLRFKLDKGEGLQIATEYINTTVEYVSKNSEYRDRFGDMKPLVITPWYRFGENNRVKIILSFGATEAKPPEDADAIVDNTETGTTIESNNLKIIDVIDRSSAILLANRESIKDEWKKEKIQDVLTLLEGVVNARGKLHIYVNVKKDNLKQLLSQLPALKKPTICPLADTDEWYSLNTVIPKSEFMKLVPVLRKLAQGLVVHEPKQVLPLEQIKSKIEEKV